VTTDIWVHKKGGRYEVLEYYASDADDPSRKLVVYRSLQNNEVWVRSHAEFMDGRFRLET